MKTKAKASVLAWLIAIVVIWWLCRDDDVAKATGGVSMGDDWEATFHPEGSEWSEGYQKKAEGG